MLPVLLDRKDIDSNLWNHCIEHARFPCLYACSWYLDAVSPDWKALVIQTGKEYSYVMPLPVHTKLNINIVFKPFYCQYLGIFSTNEISMTVLESFLKELSRRFCYISAYSFHPSFFQVFSADLLAKYKLTGKTRTTHWLSIPHAQEPLPYTADRAANLKKAQRYHWQIEESTDIKPLTQLFEENHAPHFKYGIHPKSYTWLEQLAEILLINKTGKLWYALNDGRISGGMLIAHYKGQHYYLFNAADSIGRKGNSRTWLLDQYFRTQCRSGDVFDFESPDMPLIANHYKSFGAETKSFLTIRKNGLPRIIKWLQEYRIRNSRQ